MCPTLTVLIPETDIISYKDVIIMTAKTAEEHFTWEMHHAIEEFSKILRVCFRRMLTGISKPFF